MMYIISQIMVYYMMKKYILIFYDDIKGNSPVMEFIGKLDN